MTTNPKDSKYFVVGGPVQPDRACYVLRDSDAELYQHLADGEYCYVVAPYHMGKTSLMAHYGQPVTRRRLWRCDGRFGPNQRP